MATPDKLRIPLEEGRFENVGRLPDGTQFSAYVTGAFPTGLKSYLGDDWQTKKRWLAVIHRFDAEGNHLASESRLGAFDIEGRPVGAAGRTRPVLRFGPLKALVGYDQRYPAEKAALLRWIVAE